MQAVTSRDSGWYDTYETFQGTSFTENSKQHISGVDLRKPSARQFKISVRYALRKSTHSDDISNAS
jgi:hypothetical protein